MLGLLVAISAVACFESSYADAVSITTVTVPNRGGWVLVWPRPGDPNWVNRAEIGCEYTISSAPATPPTITWLRGTFADKQVIYKWSSSGEVYVHPDFAGRVSVESRTHPTLILVNQGGWGRYWCRVTNEEQPGEFGTDEESRLFWYGSGYDLPGRLSWLNLDKTPVHVEVGGTVRLNCNGTSGSTASILWVKGPSCIQGGGCDSYETVIHKSAQYGTSNTEPEITISPNYTGRVSLDTQYYTVNDYTYLEFTPTLTITDIRPSDAGRYWCSPAHTELYSYLGTLNRDAQSVVVIVNDPGTEPTCAGKPDGMYQHPADCAQFYTCSGGLSYGTNTCPAGLVFNQELQLCDWANNVICL
uniref:chitinase n=2 Tax=Branchiostoma floridae TaxID=7739 RepID=B7FF50_BRAFL|nr:TPA_inf: variable region-containing chitin-binding protein 5 [Branchiostoma floridae]